MDSAHRVLVTGAATWVGGNAVRRLEVRPQTTVLAVDDIDPRVDFSSEFTRIGLDGLDFADLLLEFSPTAVLHLGTLDRSVGAERAGQSIVLGAQALFGAIARCPDVRRVVVKSESAVYATGPRRPSVSDEGEPLTGSSTSRHQRQLRDMESFVGTQAELHPAIAYAILRLAPIVGSTIGNAISRYLTLPVVPTQLGYDPRLQFVHEDDAVELLLTALNGDGRGVFNVAAPGQLYLSRVLRLGRRVQQPLPRRALKGVRRALGTRDIHLHDADVRLLQYGLVMDTSQAEKAGLVPSLTCRQTVLALYQRLPEVAHG